MNKEKIIKNNRLIYVIITMIIIVLVCTGFWTSKYISTKETSTKINNLKEQIFKQVEESAEVNKFVVYGTHLNLEAKINMQKTADYYKNIKDIKLAIYDIDKNEILYNIEYEIEENEISICTSQNINEGIYLENFNNGEYYLLIKVIDKEENVKYYSLLNKTEYKDIEYYTITKNKSNQKITISFNDYSFGENKTSYMYINVIQSKLPADVYDVVIDPGHGGTDGGATAGGYNEADLALDVSEDLKAELEDLGLKVLLTRDRNSDKDEVTAYTMYDENGRVNITNASKAKLVLSIHLNSTEVNTLQGVEVYAPSKANLSFAKSIADNIATTANTKYSTGYLYKKLDGVYVRTFDKSTINDFKDKAIKKGYEPYNITEDTPYLYIIRETGGICTNAIIDGRNTDYGKNLYYNSNIGLETYLIELGYINNKIDRTNIINNGNLYAKAIANSVKQYFGI